MLSHLRIPLALLAVFTALTACAAPQTGPTTLRVIASPELADMRPILDELRDETGITVELNTRVPADPAVALKPGETQYHAAWLSSDQYFRLKGKQAGVPAPFGSSTMQSPVVVGMRPEAAAALRAASPDGRPSWADIADQAATGQLRFAMADPQRSGTGLAALIGVATAAAGKGQALQAEDVSCDRLRGFFTGHALTGPNQAALVDDFAARQPDVAALIGHESTLLTLNRSGKLPRPLELIYPRDGMVLSDFPLLLLDRSKQDIYNKVLAWLTEPGHQKKIMETTLRRPVDPTVPRDPALAANTGNALYFPTRQQVVDSVLASYTDPAMRLPSHVIFVLDSSSSMRGGRMAALRATFAGFTGADDTPSGKFARFYQGEQVTIIRFAGGIRGERTFTVNSEADLSAIREFVAADDFADGTAIWSALDHGLSVAASAVRAESNRPVPVVLMTDGENNAGASLDNFLQRQRELPEASKIHVFAIRVGEADPAQLDRAARATGGRMVEAQAGSLQEAFKEIRGCH